MQKRVFAIFLILLLAFSISAFGVLAQEDFDDDFDDDFEDNFEDNFDDGSDDSLDNAFDDFEDEFDEEGEEDFDDDESDNDLEDESDDLRDLEDDSFDEENDFDEDEDFTDAEIEEELGDGGSINGFDRFFDNIFQNDLENMRERFAEIRTLIKKGEIEEAKELLDYYKEVADNLEKEVDPEQRDEVVRLTKIIRKEIRNLEDRLGDDEFDVLSERAKEVGAAAEIAHKIKGLCDELHELRAWEEFERVCKTDDSGPKWQKDLYEGLTKEQGKEVKKFVKIMSQCMRTSGEDCNCAEIPHEGMVAMCFQAAPLARDCELIDRGDLDPEDERFDGAAGDACDQLDALEFPDLPAHLLRALEEVEDEFGEASYENHIPGPCKDAGITGDGREDREKCFSIMVEREAPPECRDAIKEAGADNEGDARRICEKIMFEQHAPEECVNEGITDPRECAEKFGGFGPRDDFDRRGPDRGKDCGNIDNSEERLRCYDDTEKDFDDKFEDRRGPNRGPPGGWPGPCREAEAFTRESCEKIMRADGDKRFEETKREERQCANSCEAEGKAWDFSFGCRCFGGDFRDDFRRDDFDDHPRDRDDFNDRREEFREEFGDNFDRPPENFDDFQNQPPEGFDDFPDGGNFPDDDNFDNSFDESPEFSPPEDSESGDNSGSGGEDNSGSSSGEESGDSGGGEDGGGDGGTTGSVIFTGNAFFEYYYS